MLQPPCCRGQEYCGLQTTLICIRCAMPQERSRALGYGQQSYSLAQSTEYMHVRCTSSRSMPCCSGSTLQWDRLPGSYRTVTYGECAIASNARRHASEEPNCAMPTGHTEPSSLQRVWVGHWDAVEGCEASNSVAARSGLLSTASSGLWDCEPVTEQRHSSPSHSPSANTT